MELFDQISLDPVFGWTILVPVAVLLIASLWLSFTSQGLSRSKRFTLFMLRFGAMLILILGCLRPSLVSEVTRETPGAIAVLMDTSKSMELPSEASDMTRWEAQIQIWNRIESSTNLTLGETKIIPYFYSDKPVPVDAEDLPKLQKSFGNEPTGRVTDLGQTLSEISQLQVEPPLRGVILIGDATQTVVPATIDPSLIARQMGQLDQPVLMVGLGNRGDASQIRDIAVEGLPEKYPAFVKKEIGVRFVVNAKGMQNRPVQLELRLRASGKKDILVGTKKITPARSKQLLPQEFTIEVDEAGDYLLEVSAIVDGDDQIPSNNTALSFISVREGGAKILLIDTVRSESRFTRLSISDSPDFDVEYYPMTVLDRKNRRGQPKRIEQDIEFRDYDVIIIGNVHQSEISPAAQQAIVRRVREGMGIIFTGGYYSFAAGGYGESRMRELFPVELGRGQGQRFDQPINRSFHVEGDVKIQKITNPHPITTIMTEPENSDMWAALPALDGMNRLSPKTTAPGVQVLLMSTNYDPILVKGQASNGRVLSLAADTTYRWWLAGKKNLCKQFWRQAILWLINRENLSEGFKLDMETRRMLVDQTPDMSIQWFAGTEEKPMPEDAKIQLSRDGLEINTLIPTKSGPNRMELRLSGLRQPGLYRAKLEAKESDGTSYQSDIAFVVKDESRELARPDADWQMMKNIVSANQAAEGRLVLPDEIDRAIQLLRDRQESAKITSIEKRQLGDSPVDSWAFLVVFCVLMSIEWGLRKSWQLP